MKKYFLLLVLVFTFFGAAAQPGVKCWVVFKDKNNSPFKISEPSQYLSQRAILRRQRQAIAITITDFPVNPAYLTGLQAEGAAIIHTSRWMNAALVTLPEDKIKKLSKISYIKNISRLEKDKPSPLISKFELEERHFQKEENSRAAASYNYGPSYNQAHMIGADCMHEKGFKGEGMVIAVLDAGFYNANILPAFDSLRVNGQILGCRDFVSGDTLVYEDYPHGMNVLSCMGGNLPGRIVGTAPQADYWLIRTEESASETMQEEINWLKGAEFADSVGADIINSSLGYSVFDDASTNHTYADLEGNSTIVTKAADMAAAAGILVVSSAGNSGGYPWFKITAPADADSILTVGAVDASGTITGFSSRGPTADGRIKPNTVAQGGGSTIAANGGDITFANGTSFSSPITAGAAACLWQAHPDKSNMEIIHAIQQSASKATSPDTVMGYGIPDFCKAHRLLGGVEDIVYEESFSVYPNPFKNDFQFAFYSAEKQTVLIELFDITGKAIYSESADFEIYSDNRFHIPANNLAAGVYMIIVKTDKKTYQEKVLKQ
ncbi:MAG TPA: S8 family serine peptidase [Bacteroidia bacterium]